MQFTSLKLGHSERIFQWMLFQLHDPLWLHNVTWYSLEWFDIFTMGSFCITFSKWRLSVTTHNLKIAVYLPIRHCIACIFCNSTRFKFQYQILEGLHCLKECSISILSMVLNALMSTYLGLCVAIISSMVAGCHVLVTSCTLETEMFGWISQSWMGIVASRMDIGLKPYTKLARPSRVGFATTM
jgi:hypothetical protein